MQNQRQTEFIALMAALMTVPALAIDAILPALDVIGASIGTVSNSEDQGLIIMIFLGLGIGPLLFGPISDSIGRKPMVYLGFAIFVAASILCVEAPSYEVMIAGRILQGIGLSAPRTICISIVRDTFSGNYMARVLSFITVVFLLVPIIAPTLGKVTLDAFNWEAIFYLQLVIAILISIWFWKRQPETLELKNRILFKKSLFIDGTKELFKYKSTIGYTLISGFITGSFIVYLSTSQQIFEEQYDLKEEFPYIFAALAISLGAAILLNGWLVIKYGMEKLTSLSLYAFSGISLIYILLFYNNSNPGVLTLIGFFSLQFFAIGFLFGNVRALAMEPIGHIAGIGAAVTGFISTLMAVPISLYIGTFVSERTLPIFIGFLICSVLSILILKSIQRSNRKAKAMETVQ
jgi:DHA1 family bicyclomycin/chloramphenicol resistance-like MFS transporter